MYMFNEGTVESLGYTIMLWHVMSGEFSLCPFGFKVTSKLIRQILPPMIRAQMLDVE